jgi:hypothetical protein
MMRVAEVPESPLELAVIVAVPDEATPRMIPDESTAIADVLEVDHVMRAPGITFPTLSLTLALNCAEVVGKTATEAGSTTS